MNLITYYFAAFFLLLAMSRPVTAADSNCSYSKSLRQRGITFDISSRPAIGCAIQIVTVGVRRGGKKIAGMKADVDYLARSAQVVDLNGDGTPELAVFSRTTGGMATEALDVYRLDGATLQRLTVPDLDHKSGYRGGDRIRLEDRLIVRTVPVYRDGDPAGKPTGGSRSLKYEIKEGAFSHYVQTERAANTFADSSVPGAPKSAQMPPVETIPTVHAAAGLAVTGITDVESGIEILADGPVGKFKIMKLENPERIAIDFPGATSNLFGRMLTVNRFGISTVRVGSNKDFLRIVLDTTLRKFPKHVVKSSGSGVLVKFTH